MIESEGDDFYLQDERPGHARLTISNDAPPKLALVGMTGSRISSPVDLLTMETTLPEIGTNGNGDALIFEAYTSRRAGSLPKRLPSLERIFLPQDANNPAIIRINRNTFSLHTPLHYLFLHYFKDAVEKSIKILLFNVFFSILGVYCVDNSIQ
jgi:hypothetical protein